MEKFFLHNKRIALDIDEVLADFLGGYAKWTNDESKRNAKNFYFSYGAGKVIKSLPDEFWLTLPAKIKPEDLNFLPAGYISKRDFDVSVTEQWLERNNFPCMPVLHVTEKSKYNACLELGVEYYLDDFIFNFQDLNSKGITTFLLDCSHNKQYDVGSRRINHIRELIHKIDEFEQNSIK